MLLFLARRLLFVLVVSISVVFFVFLGMGMSGNSNQPDPNYDLLYHGQDAWEDTQLFFLDMAHGEWGYFRVDEANLLPVAALLRDAYSNSMALLAVALLVAAVAGLAVGSSAALSEGASLSLLTATTLGISVPSFFAALLLQQLVIRSQSALGVNYLSVGGFDWDLRHMLLPLLVLAARPFAYLTRSVFISLNNVLRQDYIRTAHAKGLRRNRVFRVHAVANIAVPVLTAAGISLRFSLSTLPVVEYFFGWPGMGMRLIQAIDSRQTQVVVALAFLLGLTVLLVNLLLDVVYRLIDPRLAAEA